MKEVSAPVIGIALILSAVFIPVAFIPGLTGQMYQQFALTIAISVLLSAFSALSLSPALAAMLLKPAKPATGLARQVLRRLQQGLRARDERLRQGRADAGAPLDPHHRHRGRWWRWARASSAALLPAGFIPEEDQGILGVNVTLPAGVVARAHERRARPGRGDPRQDRGRRVVPDDRRLRRRHQHLPAQLRHDLHPAEALARPARRRDARARLHGAAPGARSRRIPEAIIFPFNIPTISGFGASAGFNFLLQDRSGSLSVERLGELSRAVPGGGAQAPGDRQHLHVVRPALPPGQGGARPREGAQAGRARQRGLPGAGLEPGRQLRERLQPLRAPVPRLRPGRGRLPRASPRTSARSGCAARPRTT